MHITTNVTVHFAAKEGDKVKPLAPGEHDLPDDIAKDLLKRGHAVTAAKARAVADAEAEKEKGAVKVTTTGKPADKAKGK